MDNASGVFLLSLNPKLITVIQTSINANLNCPKGLLTPEATKDYLGSRHSAKELLTLSIYLTRGFDHLCNQMLYLTQDFDRISVQSFIQIQEKKC